MGMHNMDKKTPDFERDKGTIRPDDRFGVTGLEEAIDLFTGDMTRWTLRDVEVSNGSLLVSDRTNVLDDLTYVFEVIYPSMDYHAVWAAPLPVLLIRLADTRKHT